MRATVWNKLRECTPLGLRAWLKHRRWFRPLSSKVFGNSVYSDSYYADLDRLEGASVQHIADWIVTQLQPKHVLDVGCGSGLLLKALHDRGVRVMGLDLSEDGIRLTRARGIPVERFDLTDRSHGFPEPADGELFDLIISTEVAEHLQPRFADLFVERMAKAGPRIFFTAAEVDPAQGPGLHHFNEQPNSYWIEKFERNGCRFESTATDEARRFLRERGVVPYLTKPMIFTRVSS